MCIRRSPSLGPGDSTVRVSSHSGISRAETSDLTLVIQVWCTKELTLLYVINPFLDTDAGDLFSLAWSPTLSTIYVGCQNTSVQWYNFGDLSDGGSTIPLSGRSTPRLAHKFFNSYPRSQRRPPDLETNNGVDDAHGVVPGSPTPRAELNIPPQNVIDSAPVTHYGYVYCMTLIPSTRQGVTSTSNKGVLLATGSGDETVKVCSLDLLLIS